MLLLVLTAAAAAAAAPAPGPAPASYDQRQDGELNVRADLTNVLLLIAVPQKAPLPLSLNVFDFLKDAKRHPEVQERAGLRGMEAFVEPSEPYRVEIGEGGGGAGAEVLIGRRDEPKLLGATEQCGPARVRDPATLLCRDETPAEAADGAGSPPPAPAAPAAPAAPVAPAAPAAPAELGTTREPSS